MQILGLLGMYFDAVVVEVEKYFFFQIGSGHTVCSITAQNIDNKVLLLCLVNVA